MGGLRDRRRGAAAQGRRLGPPGQRRDRVELTAHDPRRDRQARQVVQDVICDDCRFDADRGGAVCLACKSSAPRLSNGARRIILRAAQTDYNLVSKLDGHPDWPEAARRYRPFVLSRIDRRIHIEPELP